MKIIISKLLNKIQFAKFIRSNDPKCSLSDVKNLLTNLPIVMDVDYYSEKFWKEGLNDIAEFEVIKSKEEIVLELKDEERRNYHKNYEKAQEWYDSLSDEHKKYVETLMRAYYPIPCSE